MAVALGDTATFVVVADGTGPFAFQWQFNGTSLPGATNASLVVSNVQESKAGPYAVLVSNPAGAVTSAAGTLTISTAVSIAIEGQGMVGKVPDKPFYNADEQLTLTATPGRWFAFTGWSDGPTLNPRTITIGANNSYTAIFSPTTAVETLTFGTVSRTAPLGMPLLFVDGEVVVAGAVTRMDAAEISMLTTFPKGSIFYTLGRQRTFVLRESLQRAICPAALGNGARNCLRRELPHQLGGGSGGRDPREDIRDQRHDRGRWVSGSHAGGSFLSQQHGGDVDG